MAIIAMIMGESGSGKSASLRTIDPKKTFIFNVTNKPLPFKGANQFKSVSTDDIDRIINGLKAMYEKGFRSFVIDDANYTMTDMFMAKALEKGYEKFSVIGKKFFDLINYARQMPDDAIVYFFMHTEACDDGKTRAKTIGKMLNDKVSVEGMFSIVLLAVTDGKKHVLITQSDGTTTAKSPMDMFDLEIPNDLGFVDKTIREYYDMPALTDKETKSE